MNSQSLTTLARVRSMFNRSADATVDAYLDTLIDAASAMIAAYCRRKFRLQTHIEYHDGDGGKYLFLDHFPVNSITSIYDDVDWDYEAADLIDSDDYTFDSTGRVILYNGVFTTGDKNIKATYVGGYEEFEIITGYNDKINFKVAAGGVEKTATLTAGTYTAATLATHIGTVMTAAAGGDTITVTYNIVTGKFTIASNGTVLQLLWLTGTNTATSVGTTIGFSIIADDTGATSYTADNSILGIPGDIQLACEMIVLDIYKQSLQGGGERAGLASESAGGQGGGTVTYLNEDIPLRAKMILNKYRKVLVA